MPEMPQSPDPSAPARPRPLAPAPGTRDHAEAALDARAAIVTAYAVGERTGDAALLAVLEAAIKRHGRSVLGFALTYAVKHLRKRLDL